MAFVKKTWKDRIVQYANRRLLTKSGGEVEQVTVTRDEGTISEAGDQFNASNMNNLEQRIYDAFQFNFKSKVVWSGSSYTVGDTLVIPNFSANKVYVIKNKAFSSENWSQNAIFFGSDTSIQYAVWGDSTQFARYRLTNNNGTLTIHGNSLNNNYSNAITEIRELCVE